MPWSCGCAGEVDFGIPVHDKAVVARYRKIREHARRSEGQEKETAKALLKKLRDQHLQIKVQAEQLDHAEAVAKANEHVAQAATARAAAMNGSGATSSSSAADQIAYWSSFIEETITYIADHPDEPAPSAVAFVETLDLGEAGRIFTSIKKMGARTLAQWADNQIAELVDELLAMQRDFARGKLPAAVQNVVNRATSKLRPKKKKKSSPQPARKRKKHMAEALLRKIEDECDCAVSESEDKDTGEELFEIELVIPKSLWPKIKESPEALVAYLVDALDDAGDDDEEEEEDDEPSDSGLALDPNDPFPDDDDEPTPEDADDDDELRDR
jgi:hypothetical protein